MNDRPGTSAAAAVDGGLPVGFAIRPALAEDVPAIVAMFADDALGGHGDTSDPALAPVYCAAFERIAASPSDRLYVLTEGARVVGTAQLTLITSLTHRGRVRALIEAVQVAAVLRGRGLGAALIRRLVADARAAGAGVVELTSNKVRRDAHRFYERLGFERSHEGFKLPLA